MCYQVLYVMSRSAAGHCPILEHSRQVILPSHLVRKLNSEKSDAQTGCDLEALQIFSFVSVSHVDVLTTNLTLVLGYADHSYAQVRCGEYSRSFPHLLTGFSPRGITLQVTTGRRRWNLSWSAGRSTSRLLILVHKQRSALSVSSNKTVEYFHFFSL